MDASSVVRQTISSESPLNGKRKPKETGLTIKIRGRTRSLTNTRMERIRLCSLMLGRIVLIHLLKIKTPRTRV